MHFRWYPDCLLINAYVSNTQMSTLTQDCLDAYTQGVNNTCDAVDTSIKVSVRGIDLCSTL